MRALHPRDPKAGSAGPPAGGPWWLLPAMLFDGERMRSGMALRIEHGRIMAVANVANVADTLAEAVPCWQSDYIACPAFVDCQVNGGGGRLFTNEPTAEALAAIAAAHRRGGTGAWLPTLLTSAPSVMEQAVEAVLAVYGQHGVAGMHIEGPHLSPDFRGAHALELIRPYDEHTRGLLRRLRDRDIPVILTLAPERLPPGALRELVAMGVRVSIGHSGAGERETRAALAGGASLFTHLFNGMPPLQTKNPGMAGVALDSGAWCGVIADGWHVDDTMLRLVVRAKRQPGTVFAVTDAMPTVHGPPQFELYGAKIYLREGKLIDGRGSLAGVHIDMIGTLRRLVRNVELPLETALAMVTSIPARAAGLDGEYGVLAAGARANILLLDPDRLCAGALIIDGARVADGELM
ncbi:MAG TPA: N-acetylglucosamine-6-phosphate deacetylase [Steroidobacteraceae bacterium]|jgi:N-acetylglucosamine-6-phosphate deacetylase|nr:N-acetylglucosamine-6-phosphate deacetylase [Steroidobacteraceae bacterium]